MPNNRLDNIWPNWSVPFSPEEMNLVNVSHGMRMPLNGHMLTDGTSSASMTKVCVFSITLKFKQPAE